MNFRRLQVASRAESRIFKRVSLELQGGFYEALQISELIIVL